MQTVTLDGKSPITVTFSVATSSGTASASFLPLGTSWVGFLALAMVLLALSTERTLADVRARVLVRCAMVAIATLVLAACGGGFSAQKNSTTVVPSVESFTLKLSATTGNVTHSTTVRVQVQ